MHQSLYIEIAGFDVTVDPDWGQVDGETEDSVGYVSLTDSYGVATSEDIYDCLATTDIYSCIAITAYDTANEIGFLTHTGLTDYPDENGAHPHLTAFYDWIKDAAYPATLEANIVVGDNPDAELLHRMRVAIDAAPDHVTVEDVSVYYPGEDGPASLPKEKEESDHDSSVALDLRDGSCSVYTKSKQDEDLSPLSARQ